MNRRKPRWKQICRLSTYLICFAMGVLLLFATPMSIATYAVSMQEKDNAEQEPAWEQTTEVSQDVPKETPPSETIVLGDSRVIKMWKIGGVTYVPLRDFSAAFVAVSYTYDQSSGYATLHADGLILTAGVNSLILTANGRYLYTVGVNRMIDGQVWVSLRALSKALGLTLSGSESQGFRVSGSYRPILSGDQFYREDEVYWLSKIIYAESGGEVLRGQIAVGNVVLNRVRHRDFPNTIYGVIFDQKYGVQFTPTANGMIYQNPSWTSVVAAKMCLEGYSVAGDALYFVANRIVSTSWVGLNRPYLFTLGGHSFFA